MPEPVVFIPRIKPPTLLKIWIPFLILSIVNLSIACLTKNTLIIFCLTEAIWFLLFVFSKFEIQVVIFAKERTFNYYYMNCWGEEKIVSIDVFHAQGSYKYTRISQAKSGWQLIFYNHKRNKVVVSQGGFKKFQLDEMVRMINQIKKKNLK